MCVDLYVRSSWRNYWKICKMYLCSHRRNPPFPVQFRVSGDTLCLLKISTLETRKTVNVKTVVFVYTI